MGGGNGFDLLTYFYCSAQRFRTQIHRDPSRSRSVHAHKLLRLCFSSWAAESTASVHSLEAFQHLLIILCAISASLGMFLPVEPIDTEMLDLLGFGILLATLV